MDLKAVKKGIVFFILRVGMLLRMSNIICVFFTGGFIASAQKFIKG
jgi:hypothetical protein